MLFWFIAALLVVAVSYPMLRALNHVEPDADPLARDVAFYQAQEREIERQIAAGVMSAEEGQAAKAEAGRKLLALARTSQQAGNGSARGAKLASVALLVAIPALTLPLYFRLGQPGAPDLPYALRADIDRSEADIRRLIARLDAHLAESPQDARGWELALPVYIRLGRFEDAVVAATRLLDLKGESAERLTTLAEAKIFTANGRVDEDTAQLLARALALEPAYSKARFYAALGRENRGDIAGALSDFKALATDVTEPAEQQAVGAQIARLSKMQGTGSAADAIKALSEADRQQVIRGMVDTLSERLRTKGGSPEEWQRLIRAFTALGEKDKAKAALAEARVAHSQNNDALLAITALARELSLEETKP